MDSASLELLIVGSISVIGLIQLIIWTVMIMEDKSFEYLRLEPAPPSRTGVPPEGPLKPPAAARQ